MALSILDILNNIQLPNSEVAIDENYVYIDPVKDRSYSVIRSNNKTLSNIIQTNVALLKKITKNEERINTLNYFNYKQSNRIKLVISEIMDIKNIASNSLLCSDKLKSNIINTIFYELIFLQENKIAFSIELLWDSFPILKKYIANNFNKKYNNIYECLHIIKPNTYKHEYKSYFDLPPEFYFRGIRIIMRTFYMDALATKDIFINITLDDYNNECITTCKKIEDVAIMFSVWIIMEDCLNLNASRINDYYKIYCIACLLMTKDKPINNVPTELAFLMKTLGTIDFPIQIDSSIVEDAIIYIIKCMGNYNALTTYGKRLVTLYKKYNIKDMEQYINDKAMSIFLN